MSIVRIAALVAATVLGGCTYGAPAAGRAGLAAAAVVVDVNLTAHAGGYAPPLLSVPTGTRIQFTNSDAFAHTATAIAGATFPAASPFDGNALTPAGSGLSAGSWGTGTLAAGASSQVFVADLAGTYLYGCFFHYGSPMRGSIVVR